ncbi:MAG: hypothetical protein SWX82_24640 [Cyanobacteriota bacterium]|nr:hypothetical protein [Cyanobacteriota bacterium]
MDPSVCPTEPPLVCVLLPRSPTILIISIQPDMILGVGRLLPEPMQTFSANPNYTDATGFDMTLTSEKILFQKTLDRSLLFFRFNWRSLALRFEFESIDYIKSH